MADDVRLYANGHSFMIPVMVFIQPVIGEHPQLAHARSFVHDCVHGSKAAR